MTDNQLAQMAISAILRCKEKIDIIELNHVLRGTQTPGIKLKGFNQIKTFGAGKNYTRANWLYWLIQLIQQDIICIDYNDDGHLKVLEKGHQVLKGELDVVLKNVSISPLTIKREGVTISIDPAIQDSIDWRKYISELNNIVYWNYSGEKRLDIDKIIPLGIPEREQVKARYREIVSQVFQLTIEGDTIIIPKKIDYDMFGKEVLPLSLPFEECLERLRQFIVSTGRYPQMNAVAEETALRKWFREVGHGLIDITSEQRELFRQFKEQYSMSTKANTKDQ